MLKTLHVSARFAAFELPDGGHYHSERAYQAILNGKMNTQVTTCVFTLFDLEPGTDYLLELKAHDQVAHSLRFSTKTEKYTLNIKDFGAYGDGRRDDTAMIQAAIMACPKDGRVLVPKGEYLVSSLFLKSDLRLEIAKGATLKLNTDRGSLPIMPGMLASNNGEEELNLGTWEGNPLPMHAALLHGMNVQNVEIYGEGALDGQAQDSDWWVDAKKKRGGAWRGRMVFINRCEEVTLCGLTIKNSPSWNIHPYFSRHLRFYNLAIEAPKDSPNTDGLNPESCQDVDIAGTRFSLGDDCVAIKSGKIYMGSTYKTPSHGIFIRHSLMENGHGGVTIGSEMAGGVRDVRVQHCLMRNTDRGLRVKTRRGRGEQAQIDSIHFEDVVMDRVLSPIVVNFFYFCDPDGHSDYVQNRAALEKDARTPGAGKLSFTGIKATGVGTCAAFFLGLPENPIADVSITDSSFVYDAGFEPAVPAMADGIEPIKNRGVIAHNVKRLRLRDVRLIGYAGEAIEAEHVEQIDWRDEE